MGWLGLAQVSWTCHQHDLHFAMGVNPQKRIDLCYPVNLQVRTCSYVALSSWLCISDVIQEARGFDRADHDHLKICEQVWGRRKRLTLAADMRPICDYIDRDLDFV